MTDEIRPDWDEYFINIAYMAATRSKDTSTRVGCVIVGPDKEIRSTGYNNPPRGFDDSNPILQQRPEKYSYFVHAEENAIALAARSGIQTKGCTLYCTWTPCMTCARMIIQSGISAVIVHREGTDQAAALRGPDDPQWKLSLEESVKMMRSCGVYVRFASSGLIPVKPRFFGKDITF